MLPRVTRFDSVAKLDAANVCQQIPVMESLSAIARSPATEHDLRTIWKQPWQVPLRKIHRKVVGPWFITEVDLDCRLSTHHGGAEGHDRLGLLLLVRSKVGRTSYH